MLCSKAVKMQNAASNQISGRRIIDNSLSSVMLISIVAANCKFENIAACSVTSIFFFLSFFFFISRLFVNISLKFEQRFHANIGTISKSMGRGTKEANINRIIDFLSIPIVYSFLSQSSLFSKIIKFFFREYKLQCES